RTGWRTSCTMCARTAAAVLSRGRSGQRRNGGRDCRSRSARHRTNGYICPTDSTILLRIRRSFGISRLRSAELSSSFRDGPKDQARNLEIPGSMRSLSSGRALRGPVGIARNDKSFSRQNCAFDFAKADPIAVALAPAAHRERIAVFEKRPDNAARQLDRLPAVPADFQKAAALVLVRAAD